MEKTYLKGTQVRLRALEPEDLETLYDMENNPQMWEISSSAGPCSRHILREYIANTQCDMFADRQLRLVIERLSDQAVVGMVDITDFAPAHGRGEVGIAIQAGYRKQGYAREALQLLCEYVFGFLFFKQLTAHVSVDNEGSLQLFRACGFQQCGILKEWWRVSGGRYVDVAVLQRLREWQA